MQSAQLSPDRRRRATETQSLRRRVLAAGLATSAATTLLVGLAAAWFVIELRAAIDGVGRLGPGVLPLLFEERPLLLVSSAVLAAAGLFSGAASATAVIVSVGRDRRPPARALAAIGLPVIVFSTLGLGVSYAQVGWPAVMLVAAGGLSFSAWLFGPLLTVWTAALASMALNYHRQQAMPLVVELPDEAAEYFDEVAVEVEGAGFERIGDRQFHRAPGRYQRVWIGAEGTLFVSALHRPTGDSVLQATSAFGLIDDGTYVETTNAAVPLTLPEEIGDCIQVDRTWSPAEVVERHLALLQRRLERGGSATRFDGEQVDELQEYGMAWLGRQMRFSRRGRATAEMLWLGDPFWAEPLAPPIGVADAPVREAAPVAV